MDTQRRLARAYRALLLTYPRRYRRARGAELLSTLLDAAGPDRRRPTWREAADLILGGLHCRFAVSGGPAAQVAAVVMAIVGALAVSAAAAWTAWLVAPTVPTLAEGTAVAQEAVPGNPMSPPVQFRDPTAVHRFGLPDEFDEDLGGDRPAPESVEVTYPLSVAQQPDAAVEQARSRLTEGGWRTGDVFRLDGYASIWGTRDTMLVQVLAVRPPEPTAEPYLHVRVHRAEPGGVVAASLVGLAIGLVAGWLATGWVSRRIRTHTPGARAGVALVAIPSVALAGIVAVTIVPEMVRLAIDGPGWSAVDALYPAFRWYSAAPLTVLCLAGLLGTAALAARPTRGAPEEDRRAGANETRTHLLRYGSRAVATLHLTFAIAWVVVVIVYATVIGGDREGMLAMEYDPKDIVDSPLALPWTITYLACLVGSLVSPALLTLSVPMLMFGRTVMGSRTWGMLLVAVVAATITPISWLTGLQSDLTTWLLD